MGRPFSELPPGFELGGYKIIRTLGKGGMATVYLAQHPRLPRQYALKVLSPHLADDPQFRSRFEREAHLAAQLDHPNVVAVHDRGIDAGLMWLAMQYVNGSDVGVILQSHPHGLSIKGVISIAGQAAAGLDAAHRQGMLHRDVKPANLLVTPDGRVLVTDFGIARALDDASNLTATGMLVATIAYAAPEVISGEEAGPQSDVYSLGCTLYEVLTGTRVFPRTSRVAVMDAHLRASPPRPSELRTSLPPAIDAVIAKALAKNPRNRYQSCRELADAVIAALSGGRTQVLASAQPRRRPYRRFAAIAGVAAMAAAGIGAAGFALWPEDKSPFEGLWIGSVVGDTSGRLVARVSGGDEISATVDYPDILCSGVWKETGAPVDDVHTLSETITTGDCPASTVTLKLQTDGTLAFTSTYFATSKNSEVVVTSTLSREIDLGLDVPITVPACDGMGIVMLGASVTPGSYADDVETFLDKHPGASYLRTDVACPSLRQATPDGDPIYAVYRVAGMSTEEVCAAVRSAGGDAYGTWLDKTSDPTQVVNCG